MSKINVKGLSMVLFPASAARTTVVPTAISTANPASITVADSSAVTEGDLAQVTGTGVAELDGKTFLVGTVSTGTFELVGADTSAANIGTMGAGASIDICPAADNIKLCLSSIDIQSPTVGQVDVSTFCSEATISGRPVPGQVTINGYADKADAGYGELLKADADGQPRPFAIVFSGANGALVGEISLSGMGWEVPQEGAVGFSLTGSQTERIRHVWK